MTAAELKLFLRIVYRCGTWIQEFAKYSHSLHGSIDGQFPFLVNSSVILGPEDRAILQRRLDELDGRAESCAQEARVENPLLGRGRVRPLNRAPEARSEELNSAAPTIVVFRDGACCT